MRRLFCFVKNLNYSVIWLLRQVKNENFKNYVTRNCMDKELVILCNGPSLAEELDKMHPGKEYCAVNSFSLSSDFFRLKPIMYVLADPLYFETKNADLRDDFHIVETINNLNEVDWKMKLFIPYVFIRRSGLSSLIKNNNIEIIPYHTNAYKGFRKVKFYLFGKGISMPTSQNVLVPSIFNALNLGYSTILLYGVDHSWMQNIIVDEHNVVCMIKKHFNNSDKSYSPYYQSNGELFSMSFLLQCWSVMFKSYDELYEYSQYLKNIRIYNMTANSFIDAFERKSIHEK